MSMAQRTEVINEVMAVTSLAGQIYGEVAARAGILDAVWTAANQTACETAVRETLCNALFPQCDAGCHTQVPHAV